MVAIVVMALSKLLDRTLLATNTLSAFLRIWTLAFVTTVFVWLARQW
jgi:hypothetical protein